MKLGRHAVALLFASSVAACTFGGLSDYPIDSCTPAALQANDTCERLNNGSASCTPYQCDANTRTCMRKTRDDDRDGDPPVQCGGNDCNDAVSTVSSNSHEACNGVDDNCDGQTDEGVVGIASRTTLVAETQASMPSKMTLLANGGVAMACYQRAVGPTTSCISAATAKQGQIRSGCAFALPPQAIVDQLSCRPVGSGVAAAYVDSSGGCVGGALSFEIFGAGEGKVTLPCGSAGVALPTPGFVGGTKALFVLYTQAQVAGLANPITGCPAQKPAPVMLASVQIGAGSPTLGAPVQLAPDGIGVRPPPILDVASIDTALVAIPTEKGVLAGTIDKALKTTLAPVSGLAGARSLALGMGDAGDATPIALVAETGCTPQAILMALGTITKGGEPKLGAAIEVEPRGVSIATQPAVAWVSARSEWLVTWFADGPVIRGRRFTKDGRPIGPAFSIGPGTAAAPDADGASVVVWTPSGAAGDLAKVDVGCQPQGATP